MLIGTKDREDALLLRGLGRDEAQELVSELWMTRALLDRARETVRLVRAVNDHLLESLNNVAPDVRSDSEVVRNVIRKWDELMSTHCPND